MKWWGWIGLAYPLILMFNAGEQHVDRGRAILGATIGWMLWWASWQQQ